MFPKTFHFSPLKLHKLLLQIPILPPILHERSNLSTLPRNNPPPKSPTSIRQRIMSHKDWLSTSETLKIFNTLQDPNIALQVLDILSERKDYNPNEAIYSAVLKHLALAKNIDSVDALMEKIKFDRKCRLSDEFFYDVISVYGIVGGKINKAVYTLYGMRSFRCLPSVQTFNLVLNLLVDSRRFEFFHEVFLKAPELRVVIDACSLNIVIKGLCKCGEFEAAFDVLREFDKQEFRPNVSTFSTIMDGLCEWGRVDEALGVLDMMEKEGVDADAITYNILIKGLRKKGRYQEGIDLMDRMLFKNASSYQEVLCCFIEAKRLVEAKEYFDKMSRKNVRPSFAAYKAMLAGFCEEKNVENVDWALKQMVWDEFKPERRMWEQIIECVLSRSGTSYSSFNSFLYEEITLQ